jgi:hypothetical protein
LPAIAPSSAAASATVRVIGPAVSCVAEIGTMPVRLTRPIVGRSPTIPCAAAGETIEPDVSVPIVIAARPAAAIAPLPEDEPLGVMSALYGFRTCPPSEL